MLLGLLIPEQRANSTSVCSVENGSNLLTLGVSTFLPDKRRQACRNLSIEQQQVGGIIEADFDQKSKVYCKTQGEMTVVGTVNDREAEVCMVGG